MHDSRKPQIDDKSRSRKSNSRIETNWLIQSKFRSKVWKKINKILVAFQFSIFRERRFDRHVASDIIGDFRLRTTGVTSNNSTNSGRRIRSDRLQSIGRISWNTNGALKVIKLLGKPVVNCGVIDTRARVHLAFECALRSFMRDWRLFISSADLLRLDRNSTRSERRRRERALPPSTSEISLMKTECVYVYIYISY